MKHKRHKAWKSGWDCSQSTPGFSGWHQMSQLGGIKPLTYLTATSHQPRINLTSIWSAKPGFEVSSRMFSLHWVSVLIEVWVPVSRLSRMLCRCLHDVRKLECRREIFGKNVWAPTIKVKTQHSSVIERAFVLEHSAQATHYNVP